MKYRIGFLLIFIFSTANAQQKVQSTVDRRVELFSIIFRLAGNPEYNMKLDKIYVNDIQTYFEKYKQLPVVDFAKKLAREKNMGFSKVMFLAVALEFKNNRFSLIKGAESTLAGKWDMKDAAKFVGLANDFYQLSGFENFLSAHQAYYSAATSRFDQSVTEFDQNWYLNYYGEHDIAYQVVLGLGDGGANYGPFVKPNKQQKLIYAVMGSWTFNESGQPIFPKEIYLTYLIHEFNHSFVDHLLEDNDSLERQLKTSGEALLKAQAAAMKLEGYEDWHSLINESLVRASVVRYMMDNHQDKQEIEAEILKQTKKGFLWTNELVFLLGEYESSRSRYPTLKSFYPRIISFFNTTTRQLNQGK
ncbi:DUF4932 domain-containing protein [Mucilaginibacter sp. UR6-11]|uniref:DUF4932 domain-containing protein n=1 Tax=Mucilaginibacter sp. UR6-11 TaxID=1435644 RepID=UPI001E5B7558|nr:DUF4932 domain-containing protein [Mucilaginibacter sp. UR6-11]MCC8424655.1 DUF4932 domain-containing protein [Mucilaginibacter sp. UR6-11]